MSNLSRPKFAFFIGGPLDGQRHTVEALHRRHVARRADCGHIVGPPGSAVDAEMVTRRAYYLMPSRPVNPRRDLLAEYGAIDSEVGVYHYVGSDPAKWGD